MMCAPCVPGAAGPSRGEEIAVGIVPKHIRALAHRLWGGKHGRSQLLCPGRHLGLERSCGCECCDDCSDPNGVLQRKTWVTT